MDRLRLAGLVSPTSPAPETFGYALPDYAGTPEWIRFTAQAQGGGPESPTASNTPHETDARRQEERRRNR